MASGKKEVDPAILLAHKFHLKCLFRRIVRLAHANAYWLIEEPEDLYDGVDDVKKRVAQAMRGKKKQKKLLSLADKALLNKPAADRTDHEKKYIYRIIGGLKCFKRYPNNVKRKLAAVTYFKYYGPGRVIVRQHQSAYAMYFIVTGDVTVSHLVYDGLLNVYVPENIAKMTAGDMFGEVSLLHNIPRIATCTTVGHCELLALMKEDFKNILQSTVQASWDVVRTAMSFFTYFDGLDEVSRREGCIVAKMKKYAIDEIILGDNVGIANYVYFVLAGRCQMIETMKVAETTRLGRTYYSLYDPNGSLQDVEENLNEKYFGNVGQESVATLSTRAVVSSTSQAFRALDDIIHKLEEKSKNQSLGKDGFLSRSFSEIMHKIEARSEINDSCEQVNFNKVASVKSSICKSEIESIMEQKAPHYHRESVRFSLLPSLISTKPLNIRTYFMQVCQFNAGSTFGFGENMRDRRIVALTPVECMLMPKVWLLQRNTANIWTRIRHYLDKKIPNKRKLFKEFEIERRWEEYREQLVNDVVARCTAVNSTTVHDVPYSIRLEEKLDL